jgi:hypothetical protein
LWTRTCKPLKIWVKEPSTWSCCTRSGPWSIDRWDVMVEYSWGLPFCHGGTPKSSSFISFPNINHPYWGTTIYGNPFLT